MAWRMRLWPFHSRTKRSETRTAPQKAGRAKRFLKDTRGVAALEFAMLGPPFFLLLLSMFEVGMTYTADTLLQNAVNETSRMIRTGQVQSDATMTPQKFRDMVCERISILLACDENLKIDVREFTSFGGTGFSDPLTSGGTFRPDTDFRFEPGQPCSVVLVRAFYSWTPITPGLGDAMANMSNGAHLLQATAAIRNEPFSTSRPTC
mgnify:CR=1 FL=1